MLSNASRTMSWQRRPLPKNRIDKPDKNIIRRTITTTALDCRTIPTCTPSSMRPPTTLRPIIIISNPSIGRRADVIPARSDRPHRSTPSGIWLKFFEQEEWMWADVGSSFAHAQRHRQCRLARRRKAMDIRCDNFSSNFFLFAASNHNFRNVVDKSTLINSSESFTFIHCFANLFYGINLHKKFSLKTPESLASLSRIITDSLVSDFATFFSIRPQQPSGMICATLLPAQNHHRFWPPLLSTSATMPPHAIRPKLGVVDGKNQRDRKAPFMLAICNCIRHIGPASESDPWLGPTRANRAPQNRHTFICGCLCFVTSTAKV